jgi:AbrB family looped-hinge helix DNA binding protein
MITTVTGKNQITIPAKLANQLEIQPGTRLDWSLGENGVLLVRPLPSRGELARRAAGMGRPWLPEGVDPVADLIDERSRDEVAEGLA